MLFRVKKWPKMFRLCDKIFRASDSPEILFEHFDWSRKKISNFAWIELLPGQCVHKALDRLHPSSWFWDQKGRSWADCCAPSSIRGSKGRRRTRKTRAVRVSSWRTRPTSPPKPRPFLESSFAEVCRTQIRIMSFRGRTHSREINRILLAHFIKRFIQVIQVRQAIEKSRTLSNKMMQFLL